MFVTVLLCRQSSISILWNLSALYFFQAVVEIILVNQSNSIHPYSLCKIDNKKHNNYLLHHHSYGELSHKRNRFQLVITFGKWHVTSVNVLHLQDYHIKSSTYPTTYIGWSMPSTLICPAPLVSLSFLCHPWIPATGFSYPRRERPSFCLFMSLCLCCCYEVPTVLEKGQDYFFF